MTMDQSVSWAVDHPEAVAVAAGLLLAAAIGVCWTVVRRTDGAVLTAGIGALVATAFSADTSWRFADHQLHMQDGERLALFAAGEFALLACAVMARANKKATATADKAGTPGVPGVLVWCITTVQVIPAYSESGLLGGTVRTVFGPVMAALLWHLAMGLEIRVARPEALSSGLPAQIGAELRERLLSYLGLATRNRTAEQISRDRATARAVRLASRRWLGPWGRAALAASVARSQAAVHGEQSHQLLQQLAGRRSAAELRTVPVVSPWVVQPVPDPYPATPLGVTGAELRRMDPLAAIHQIRSAHPGRTPAEIAALCTEYGVPVSETQVRIALRAGNPDPVPASVPAVPERPELAAAPAQTPAAVPAPGPVTDPADVPVPAVPGIEYTASGLHLDITTEPEVRREFACAVPAAQVRPARTRREVHARVPDVPESSYGGSVPPDELADGALYASREAERKQAARTQVQAVPAPDLPVPQTPAVPGVPVPDPAGMAGTDDPAALLARARTVDADHRSTHRRPASIASLKRELGIGQKKATAVRAALDAELNVTAGHRGHG
ncbi:hypothetical protein [Streptomyces sp. DSM 40484]|uniref:hypothetical protein n=1 Tax=Streptomyces kroppenstedtii TaxID=3051181 RepID=UPI0028D53F50|nr:hypothetical protein [Streptomyces sp. DSM 40484]